MIVGLAFGGPCLVFFTYPALMSLLGLSGHFRMQSVDAPWVLLISLPFVLIALYLVLEWSNGITILTDVGIEGRNFLRQTVFKANWDEVTDLQELREGPFEEGPRFRYGAILSVGSKKLKLTDANPDLIKAVEERLYWIVKMRKWNEPHVND